MMRTMGPLVPDLVVAVVPVRWPPSRAHPPPPSREAPRTRNRRLVTLPVARVTREIALHDVLPPHDGHQGDLLADLPVAHPLLSLDVLTLAPLLHRAESKWMHSSMRQQSMLKGIIVRLPLRQSVLSSLVSKMKSNKLNKLRKRLLCLKGKPFAMMIMLDWRMPEKEIQSFMKDKPKPRNNLPRRRVT